MNVEDGNGCSEFAALLQVNRPANGRIASVEADAKARYRQRRDEEWDRRQIEAEQRAADERVVAEAVAAAPFVLPGDVGPSRAALLDSGLPFRSEDGRMSFRAVSRTGEEGMALARAILALDTHCHARLFDEQCVFARNHDGMHSGPEHFWSETLSTEWAMVHESRGLADEETS